MYSGEKSLRVLVEKWIGPGEAMTARVTEFSRTPSDRRRYVRVVALWRGGYFTIVFFRHDDGSWNVFPSKSAPPSMGTCFLAMKMTGVTENHLARFI
jgi:hypothetical protein